MADLLEQTRQSVVRQQLFSSGARVVAAVSGGADSVALLHLLIRLASRMKLTVVAAHLDHSLRAESAADAQWVEALSRRLGAAFAGGRENVRAFCEAQSLSLEEGARRLRYAFLLEAARRHSASHIVLAHTADDQAETVLMRLLRGAGLLGLSAIAVKRPLEEVCVVRPLISVWRSDVEAYLKEQGLTWREDHTNQDQRFFRNRIRHELLPLLERNYNPALRRGLVQLAEQSRGDDAFLQAAAGRQWKRIAKVSGQGRVSIKLGAFRRQPPAMQRQLLRHSILAVRGSLRQFEFRHWQEMERLLAEKPPGSVLNLPGGVEVLRQQQTITISLACSATVPTVY